MKFLTLVTVMSGMAAAAPAHEALMARAVSTPMSNIKAIATSSAKALSTVKASTGSGGLLNVGVGGSSSPLVNVGLLGATVIAVGGSTPKSSSAAAALVSSKPVGSAIAGPMPSYLAGSVTVAPTSTATFVTQLPATFSAPIQGVGKLALTNLPAMPSVIDKTFSGVLGTVYGLLSGACNTQYQCSITIAGKIESLLVDGASYSGSTTINAWCDAGKCYGAANPTLTATSPFVITCDQLTGSGACSATIAGAANAIFTNGKQLEAWGWLTPAGYCQNGVCTASISAYGDPMY